MARGNYEGLAKFATISAIIFAVSLGLCGATVLVGGIYRLGDSWLPLGILEMVGMAAGAAGLFAVGVAALIRYLASFWGKDEDPHE